MNEAGGVVLGLDPGTLHFGWGVVERRGTRLVHRAHGVISPAAGTPLADRLVELEAALSFVVSTHAPGRASIESIFFAKNAQSAVKLGHARAVGLLVCARAGLAICEYPPAQVKRTVTGAGRADKLQVAHMMRALLALRELPPFDAADALALAVTCLQKASLVPAVVC